MAIVKPFKGIRPPKNLVERVESRPYDVLDSEEARAEAGDNEMSLYHIIKPEINFEPGTSEYDPRVYEEAARQFQKFQDMGWLLQDEKEQYYLYAQTSAMVTNCVKTIPLSQSAGQKLLSSCYNSFQEILSSVREWTEEDLCLSAPGFDLRGIQHEKLYSRLYMS